MSSLNEINQADRQELIDYLKDWGFAVYAAETTGHLREAAIENFKCEEC